MESCWFYTLCFISIVKLLNKKKVSLQIWYEFHKVTIVFFLTITFEMSALWFISWTLQHIFAKVWIMQKVKHIKGETFSASISINLTYSIEFRQGHKFSQLYKNSYELVMNLFLHGLCGLLSPLTYKGAATFPGKLIIQ